MDAYLEEYHKEDITDLLNNSNDIVHVSVNINLSHLKIHCSELFTNFLCDVKNSCKQWNNALLEVQKKLLEGNMFLEDGFQIKENCCVRFVNLPSSELGRVGFPNNDHTGLFVQIKGSVVRMTQSKLLEFKREFKCSKCKEIFTLEAMYEKMFVFDIPRWCPSSSGTCRGMLHPVNLHPKPDYCIDYQEIRLQELFSEKNVPPTLIVSLENDLVDTCQPGECVTICGTIERRWQPFCAGKRSEVILSMRALGICKDDEKVHFSRDNSEQLFCVQAQWQDTIDAEGLFPARDIIIESICPEIHGMYMVKLAIALSLCSREEECNHSGSKTRGHSHLLLVGDPGLAKSKLLKAASKIARRSVHTTGMGCSAAGLTAAAIKEDGEWQLEAGALVLADGGVCCIDEFSLMRSNDKASIHEAMEQQTVSMAKAGLVCKLSTRCVILAATNPKSLYTMSELEELNSLNVGIGSPLLSRFDIVLILRDLRDPEWDSQVADHLLNFASTIEIRDGLWDQERLQSHFLAVKEINPSVSQDASTILASYYQFCRSDPCRDPARTTVRLLDSLNRLAQAHARLTLREQVDGIDAVIVIRLMESSWGFGRLLRSGNILKENLPLGPNVEQVCEVLKLLNLERLQENLIKQVNVYQNSYAKNVKNSNKTEKRLFDIENLEKEFGFKKTSKKLRKSDCDKENHDETEINYENRDKITIIKDKIIGEQNVLLDSVNIEHSGTEFPNKNKLSEYEIQEVVKNNESIYKTNNIQDSINFIENTTIETRSISKTDSDDDIDSILDLDSDILSEKRKYSSNTQKIFSANIQKSEIKSTKEDTTITSQSVTAKLTEESTSNVQQFDCFDDINFSDDDLEMSCNVTSENCAVQNDLDVNNIETNKSKNSIEIISENTLNKLNNFRNSKSNSPETILFNKQTIVNSVLKTSETISSHILADQDDDLDCLNFDI